MAKKTSEGLNNSEDIEEIYPENEEYDEEDVGFDTYYGQRKRKTREELSEAFNLPSIDNIKEGQYLDFHYRGLGNGAAREIAKKLKFKKGVTLDLSDCEIGGEGVDEFSFVRLEEGVSIDFSNNHIEGLFAARFLFDRTFPEGVCIDLESNEIGDFELEEYYETYKREIKNFPIHLGKGAKLNLSDNNIGDKGAEILMNNMELEEGAELNLYNNKRISDSMKQKLKEWEKSYHDKGVNCNIIV